MKPGLITLNSQNLNKVYFFLVYLAFLLTSSCGPAVKTNVHVKGPTPQEVITYKGPKARIAIAGIQCKAEGCDKTLAAAATDMLATSLFQSGRFILLERGIGLKLLQKEINFNQTAYVNLQKAVPQGLLEGADILILGAITVLKPNESGLIIPVVIPWKHHGDQNITGGLMVEKKAYIAMDLKLVDVRTGRIIKALSVEGKAKNWQVLAGSAKLGQTKTTGSGIQAYRNTPLGKALDAVIANAVSAIIKNLPQSYYRYGMTKK